jgi:hypothetical protein
MIFKFLKIFHSPSNEIISLLKENVIGTPGLGMLYQHLEVQKKIDHIDDPYYVSLNKNDFTIGTCCFCSRNTLNNSNSIHSFYIRYFSFKEKYRTKSISQRTGITRNSKLREELLALLSGKNLGRDTTDKFFHYAYVDPRNLRSALLCKEFGFEPVRKFSTIIFNRLDPKEYKSVVEILPMQLNEVKELLKAFYKDYNMFSFENLFNSRKYYVIKDDKGKILAGIQAEPDHWRIHEMPGLSGKIILHVLSYIPYLNRLFNKDYRFLTLEGLYYAPGCEKYLEILIESLLAKYKLNSGMIWVDADSILYKILRSLNLGLVDKLNKEVMADVICKFIRFDKTEIDRFKSNPAYISGTDLT